MANYQKVPIKNAKVFVHKQERGWHIDLYLPKGMFRMNGEAGYWFVKPNGQWASMTGIVLGNPSKSNKNLFYKLKEMRR